MIEKRYDCKWTSYDISGQIWDNENPYDYMNVQEVCDRLNELTDKNEKLKSENEKLRNELIQRVNDKEVEWLRDNTIWEQMPTSKRTFTKTTLSDKND